MISNGILISRLRRAVSAFILTSVLACSAEAGTLSVMVKSVGEKPVNDAVIIATPLTHVTTSTTEQSPATAVMNQINRQFAPHVLVVKTGTLVSFPNADNIQHHVYSFSPANQFEVKLYKEFTAPPIAFNEAGIVDIGCNIHDWMLGFIVVSDSPYFGKSNDQGEVSVSLPDGDYEITFWHPRLTESPRNYTQQIAVNGETPLTIALGKPLLSPLSDSDGFRDYE